MGKFMLKPSFPPPGRSREAPLLFGARPYPLHAMMSVIGYADERSPGYRWHGLERGETPFCIFQWTVAGEGRLVYEGRRYTLEPEEAFLVKVPHDHCYQLPPESDRWRFLYLCLYGSEVLRLVDLYLHDYGPVRRFSPDSRVVQMAIDLFHRADSGRLDDPLATSAAAYAFTMELGRRETASTLRSPFAALCKEWERRLSEPLDVGEMARMAGMSRFHFTRRFRASHGIAPGDYLRQLRLRHAAHLLANPRLSIKEVAARSGLGDANYLAKIFRREMGLSPGEFRRNGMYLLQ